MRSHTLALTLVLCFAYAMAGNKAALMAVSDGTARFATNFFKAVANENQGKNLICSSLSAHVVLSMAAYGAGGNTAVQMRNSLSLPAEDNLGREGFETLIDELNSVKNVTLEVANKLYVANKFELEPQFKQLTRGSFRSEADPLDIDHPKDAAALVNGWVDEKTHSKIKSIVEEDDINSDTRMILLNAIYFKGKWAHKFSDKNTQDRPFYHMEKNEKKENKVPTMYNFGKYVYGELPDLKAKFVELPYQNKDLKMVIIVPDEIDGLSKIEENLESFNYSRLEEAGEEREVHVYLPKFKIESTIDLNPVLGKLGMTDMFTDVANFTGISKEPVKVSKVLQKAFIEVNEEGSEAAAVTGVHFVLMSARPIEKPLVLKAEKPFFFKIYNNKNNVSIFSGVVVTPKNK